MFSHVSLQIAAFGRKVVAGAVARLECGEKGNMMIVDHNAPVMVTGASGVIGNALVERLRERGHTQIFALSSDDCDLRDEAATLDLFQRCKPAMVFHMAAKVAGIMGNMVNRASAYLDNIRINTNVIDAAYRSGAGKIVAMGTTAIYSDLVSLPMSEDDIWIGPPHASEAPYGHAKRAMLAQLEAYKEQYGLEYVYCVSTNLYGPHDKFDEKFGHVLPSLVSKFARAAREGTSITVWGDGSPQRDFLYSVDAAEALCLVAEKGQGAINLASGQPVSIRHAVELLAEVSGYSGAIEWDASKPKGQMLREYSISRLASLGFQTRYSLHDGLEETYRWFCANESVARR